MTQKKYNTADIEMKRKNRISLKRSRSVASMNSNKFNIVSPGSLSKHLSLKRNRHNLEPTSYKFYDKKSSDKLNDNLTSLDVHDAKGNIVTDNETNSNKSDISHIHFGRNYESNASLNCSSGLTIDLSKNNYIPSTKPPKTPSTKSPVLEDWESYNFLPSGSSNGESYVTMNSISNSVSDSITSVVKRIPAVILSGKSTNSSSLLEKSNWENYDKDLCIFDDVVHARRNKLKVKLNRVTAHSNKRWLNIFQKKAQMQNKHEFTPYVISSLVENCNGFKPQSRLYHSSEVPKNPSLQALIKSDSDILPQKIVVPDFKKSPNTRLPGPPSNFNKPNIHYVKRVAKQSKVMNSFEKSNGRGHLVHKEQIFSPNADLKDSANSPNYPGYIPGFSSLSIRDLLQDANSRD